MPPELIPGLIVGLVGAALSYLRPRWDWGLAWTGLALVALFTIRPNWFESSARAKTTLGVLAVVAIALAVRRLFRSGRREHAWTFLVSIAGAWATVPDTESISVLLGMTAPLALAAFPLGKWTFGSSSGVLVGGLVALVVLSGAGRRSDALVGAAGALAVVAVTEALRRRGWSWTASLVLHVVLVAIWSRLAGRAGSAGAAAAWGAGLSAALIAAGSWLRPRLRPTSSSR